MKGSDLEPQVVLGLALQALAIPKLKLKDLDEAIRFVFAAYSRVAKLQIELERAPNRTIPLRLVYPQLLPRDTRHYRELFKRWAKANRRVMIDWEKQTVLEIHVPLIKDAFAAYLGRAPHAKTLKKGLASSDPPPNPQGTPVLPALISKLASQIRI
jgi:hypothetical protein